MKNARIVANQSFQQMDVQNIPTPVKSDPLFDRQEHWFSRSFVLKSLGPKGHFDLKNIFPKAHLS